MLWRAERTQDHVVGNSGQGMYWQGSDKTHRPDKPTGRGASAHGAIPRGCPMPVLQGGHCCWKTLPGVKLTQPENKCPLPDGAPAQG